MARKYIWLAQMETRHYDFEGVGRTEEEAVAGLRKRWNQHARAVRKSGHEIALFDEDPEDPDADPRTWKPGEERRTVPDYFGMWTRRLAFGEGYMDNESED